MANIGKTRIYDLAKNLVGEDVSEKEKKNLQTKKTKEILEICAQLGFINKTASSSLDGHEVSKVLNLINKGSNSTSTNTLNSTTPRPTEAESKDDPKKKSRILRRIITTKEVEAEETEEEEIIPVLVSDSPVNSEEESIETKEEEKVEKVESMPVVIEEVIEKAVPVVPAPPKAEPVKSELSSFIQLAKSPNARPAQPEKTEAQEIKSIDVTQRLSKFQANLSENKKAVTPPTTQQPYRVAKPVNTSFSPARRKGAPVPRKPNTPLPRQNNGGRGPGREREAVKSKPTEIVLTHSVTVKELALLMEVQDTEIIRNLFMKGVMRTVNQTLEFDLAVQVAADLGCTITMDTSKQDQSDDLASRLKELVDTHTLDDKLLESLVKRPPVVTIMGHVDHGKTTLLDSIRKAKLQITSTESGGITQHIGAYQIKVVDYDDNKRTVTFLDTPGHEAFTALRARGAQVTDIAILVVAADDGVMPQTIEAISHAKAAEVPIIIAVNKIDKPDANPDKVLTQLIEHGLVVEDYGGSVVCSKISAKQNLNLNDLLSKITLVADAELGDKLLANPSSLAVGAVIEASLSTSKGAVANLLVQSGTLKKGDAIVAGSASGRVRAIFNDIGQEITEAPPSTPVQILGLDVVPQAGDTFQVYKTLQEAKAHANKIKDSSLEKKRMGRGLDYFANQVREGNAKDLPIIIKADVQGSAEAIASELSKLSSDQVLIKVVHCAAGGVTENDVNLASATGAIVINFNSFIDASSMKAAQENNVAIYNCSIIYEITDSIKKAINGMLEPEKIDVLHGTAEIRQVFSIGKNKVAGCYVTSGKILRGTMAKIVRGNKELAYIRLDYLKRFKDDAKEVAEGYECGISFSGYNDIIEKDVIECWGTELQERTI